MKDKRKEQTSPPAGQKKHQGPQWRAENGDEDGNDDDSTLFPSSTDHFSLVPAKVLYWQI